MKILLVEDDPFMSKLYFDLLTAEKFIVTTADNGEIALEKIKQGGWDLILLDIILPKMDGLTIINKLKKDSPDSLKQKIIFLTNLDQSDTSEQIKQTQLPYLIKSNLNPEEFIKSIKSLVV